MDDLTNFLQETISALEYAGKTPADVKWVGSQVLGICGSWEDFAAVANFVYDSGYGSQNIESSLIVAGNDWWLERHEYDGSEWWVFQTMPDKPEDVKPLTKEAITQGETKEDITI